MQNDVLARVKKCLSEVLALSVDEIEPDMRLVDDLGAESLDLVELMYLLEQEFNIQLSKKDMSLSSQLGLRDEEIHTDEVLTPKALNLLKEQFPWAQSVLVEGATRNHLAALLTVQEVANAVRKKLETPL